MTERRAFQLRLAPIGAEESPSQKELNEMAEKKTEKLMDDIDWAEDFVTDFKKFKEEAVAKAREKSDEFVDMVLEGLVDANEIYGNMGKFAEGVFAEKVASIKRKVGWKPHKKDKNFGFVGSKDMLLRYRDLKDDLDMLKELNEDMKEAEPTLLQEQQNLCLINETLDELRFRANLSTVASVVASRAHPDDMSAGFCNLPALLCSIIFLPDTSDHHAAILLRLCKQLLAVSEAVQYEQDPMNDPIVTSSGVLSQPSARSAVPSLYIPKTCGNGETGAPEEQALPIAQDSAHCLVVTENGEVIAPSDLCMPVAKDSAMTLNSKEPPKPLLAIDTGGEKINVSVKESSRK